ncbi:MAG: plastocyanin/azurin family copper-binding protein [Nanoarchaeota archaeon]|nr:plastocyanin/azurin family copper-binding protein [Nanoarchaeota archaeon]
MKTRNVIAILAIVALLVIAGVLTGCKKDEVETEPVVTEPVVTEPEPVAEPELVVPEGKTIEIEKFEMSESDVTIEAGATVTWLNKGETKHKILIKNEAKENVDSSENLDMDDEYSYLFEEAGVYDWVSGPFAGFVRGTITVE